MPFTLADLQAQYPDLRIHITDNGHSAHTWTCPACGFSNSRVWLNHVLASEQLCEHEADL